MIQKENKKFRKMFIVTEYAALRHASLQTYINISLNMIQHIRARKLYTSASIYEWKFGKGEWKLSFASPTGRVDIFGFVIIFEEKKDLISMFYSLQKQRKHSEERSFGRFKMSWMFTL